MKKILSLLGLFTLILCLNACKKDKETDPEPTNPTEPTTFNNPPIPPATPPTSWVESIIDSTEGGGMICKTKLVKWGPQYQEVISLNPQEDVLYPGAIFNYESFQRGTYQPIIGDRKPVTFSTSLNGSAIPQRRTIQEPSLSEFREEMRTLLMDYDGVTPADMSFTSMEILSERHFDLAVGGNLQSTNFDIGAKFNFNNSAIKSRLLVQFTQKYYSVDLDTPEPGLESWFEAELSNQDQLGSFSPVYVSSVKYGRKVFILIESKTLSMEQLSGVEANFNGILLGGSVSADQTMSKLLEEKSIQVVVMGGAADVAVDLITDIHELNNYLKAGANFSIQSPGIPLSYTLRFITNNDIAKLQLYDEFTLSECFPNTAEFEIPDLTFLCPEHIAGDAEFAANGPNIEAKVWLSKENDNKELWVNVTYNLKETTGDFSEGAGAWRYQVFKAQGNRKIHSVLTANLSEYIDEDESDAMHTQHFDETELVRKMEIMGDTAGDDLGACDANHAFISVYFNPVKLKLY